MPTYDELGLGGSTGALERDRTATVFGQVMGLVALTVGCAALGAYVGRNLTGGAGIAFTLGGFVCVIGLNIANSRGHTQLATGLLFGLGLLLGIGVAPILDYYAKTQPSILWQATGATGLFIAGLGSLGYAIRRDLSYWYRTLFWALLGLIGFGLVLLFVKIPHGHIIYSVIGLGVFGAFTIFDFNRLRRATMGAAIPIAAGIFLDIFNVFLFMLQLLGGSRD
jgi:modulator of FtsH protease